MVKISYSKDGRAESAGVWGLTTVPLREAIDLHKKNGKVEAVYAGPESMRCQEGMSYLAHIYSRSMNCVAAAFQTRMQDGLHAHVFGHGIGGVKELVEDFSGFLNLNPYEDPAEDFKYGIEAVALHRSIVQTVRDFERVAAANKRDFDRFFQDYFQRQCAERMKSGIWGRK